MKVRINVRPGVTDLQLAQLRPYLVGEQPRSDGEWDMFCPLHEDANRSAQMNLDLGVWQCHAAHCDQSGTVAALIRQKADWVPPKHAHTNGHAKLSTERRERASEELSDARVAGWHAALLSDEPILSDLTSSRGLWLPVIARFEIGWDNGRKCYTIPVRDDEGALLNVRRYTPRPRPSRRKIWGVEGHNGAHLYPLAALDGYPDYIIICEGEWDAIVTNQYGFPAITRTASAITWKREWSHIFEGMKVYLCHDMDAAGQEANRKVGGALAGVAAEIRVIRLPYPLREKDGQDLTDYWLDHDGDPQEFRRLIEEAPEFDAAMSSEDPEDIGPADAAVLDAFDASKVGRPLRLTTTIKGKREPGYSVPRKTDYSCTQDAGDKCNICPMQKTGAATHVIPGGDPIILEMMNGTKSQLVTSLRQFARIQDCNRLRIKVTEHQSVEELYARPSVDVGGSHQEGGYKNIKITSVGRHDTSPNSTVQVVGALHPDPKTQHNAFLAWDVMRMETSLDRFEIDANTVKMLRLFQTKPGERPLKKIRDIADDLAAFATGIYGRPELHALIDLVYHSALAFRLSGKMISRGWLEALIVGDSRTGKSEAATRLARHYQAGEVVLCEGATLAGIVGGLQQFGSSKEWAITWGAIPLNDRRLVVLDEVGGLHPEDIAQMSGVRSSGVAELTKIQSERTYARTRLIWLGNPRNARMQDFTYGVQAIRPLIGNNEDIARFDLAMSVSSGEVPSSEINRQRERADTKYSSEACAALVRWAWSRTADQIGFTARAEREVYAAADDLGARYTEDPPLIQVANVREKLARLAVAIATRTFSTDETCERVVIERVHVRDAVAFIDAIYGMKGFGYRERSTEAIADMREAESRSADVRLFLKRWPWLAKFLRSNGKFRRQDLEEIGSIDREEANSIISELYEWRMIVKDKGDVRLTPTLHRILREGAR